MTFFNRLRNKQPAPPTTLDPIDGLLLHKALVEEYLASLTFSDDPRLEALVGAMRHSLLVGGDRVRPVLCMEVARSFGLAPSEVLPSATAVELIHTISSLHGDLPNMGNESSRRKIPACHERFGEATAILAGDGFFGESLALVTSYQKGTPQQLVEVVRELARSTGVEGMVGGRALSIDHPRSAEALLLARGKTVTLVEASARIGAILAGATPDEKERISEYARQLGLCLLILGDALEADPEAPSPEDRGACADTDDVASRGGTPFTKARRPSRDRRFLSDEALERALVALSGIRRDTAGLAGLASSVRRGAPLLEPTRKAGAVNRPIGGE